MARARSLWRLRLSRSVWDCQRLLSVLLLSTRSFQRCAGRRVGPRNGLVLLLIKKIFFASGGAAQAAGPILRFLSSAALDLRITPFAAFAAAALAPRHRRSAASATSMVHAKSCFEYIVQVVCQCGPTCHCFACFLIACLCDLLRFGHLRPSVLSVPNVTLHCKNDIFA